MNTANPRPAWQQTASEYQAMMGVHQPYIAEISPWQYSTMGKHAKAHYDTRRRSEWDASATVKQGWRHLVIEAYENGNFTLTDPGVTSEAKTAIFHYKQDQEKAAFEQRLALARRENTITYDTDVRVGDRVFTLLGGCYTTVTKVNRKSVRVESRFKGNNIINGYTYNDSDYTTDKAGLQWLHYGELVEAVKNGTPISPDRKQADDV